MAAQSAWVYCLWLVKLYFKVWLQLQRSPPNQSRRDKHANALSFFFFCILGHFASSFFQLGLQFFCNVFCQGPFLSTLAFFCIFLLAGAVAFHALKRRFCTGGEGAWDFLSGTVLSNAAARTLWSARTRCWKENWCQSGINIVTKRWFQLNWRWLKDCGSPKVKVLPRREHGLLDFTPFLWTCRVRLAELAAGNGPSWEELPAKSIQQTTECFLKTEKMHKSPFSEKWRSLHVM